RGPHFASKVSYNAGAATDDYAGQIKAELVFHNKSVGYSVSLSPSPTADTRKLPAATAFEGCRVGSFSEYGRKGRRGHTLSR
uniref:hypothetical protein n=1 Tax=Alloprevotella sp. TaxID=1872471 RepID=UPI003FF1429C